MAHIDQLARPGGYLTFHQSSFRSLGANRSYRRALERVFELDEELVFAKDMRAIASRNGFGLGIGDPRRTVTVCAWQNLDGAESFLNDSGSLASDRDWGALLEVTRTRGDHLGVKPLVAYEPAAGDGAIGALTLGLTPWRGVPRFMSHGVRLRGSLERSPGLLFATSAGWPTTGNSTFSLWESEAAMLEFAYGSGGGHENTAHARPPILSGQLNARMRVLALDGRLAQLPAVSPPAESAPRR